MTPLANLTAVGVLKTGAAPVTGGLSEAAKTAKLTEAAQSFEGMMLGEMLKELQFGGVPGSGDAEDAQASGEGGGAGETIRGMGTEALAKALAQHGGMGIAKKIVGEVKAESDAVTRRQQGAKVLWGTADTVRKWEVDMTGLDNIGSQATTLGSLNGVEKTTGTDNAKAASSSTSSQAPAETTARGADQANVSVLGGLVAQTAGTSDVRLDKVSELQAAIAGGTYKVSAGDVASKIVDGLLS